MEEGIVDTELSLVVVLLGTTGVSHVVGSGIGGEVGSTSGLTSGVPYSLVYTSRGGNGGGRGGVRGNGLRWDSPGTSVTGTMMLGSRVVVGTVLVDVVVVTMGKTENKSVNVTFLAIVRSIQGLKNNYVN